MVGRALLAFVAALMLAGAASAQNHPLTDIPEPLEGVTTSVWFPKHTRIPQFEAGETVDVVIGFRNSGPTPANVSFVAGSLNSASDFSLHFQNFSALRPAGPVVQLAADGGDASILYRFQLAQNLPEFAFQVALTAFLETEGEKVGEDENAFVMPKVHGHTVFNSTVDVVEPSRIVDWQLLQMYVMLLGLGAVGLWFAYQWAVGAGYLSGSALAGGTEGGKDYRKSGKGSSSSSFSTTSISATSSASSSAKSSDKSQWLAGTNIGQGSSKGQKKRS